MSWEEDRKDRRGMALLKVYTKVVERVKLQKLSLESERLKRQSEVIDDLETNRSVD